jgi:aspartyl/asparaginyl beta-hydroxylase (cupin superfamily)
MPSNNSENMIWINNCENFIPKIYNFVKSLKGVRNAIISRMGTNTKLHMHRGWACVANHILRSHLPIIIEEGKSGLIVFGKKQYHDVKKYIIFDDSMVHTGFNESKKDRFVLIIDFERPKNADKGVSRVEFTKGMTPEDVMNNFHRINKYYGNLKN